MKNIRIAIDGPSGAGKSSMARKLAKKLGIAHLDTGAMYRAVACVCREQEITPDEEERIISILPSLNMEILFKDEGQETWVNGKNLTPYLADHDISMLASSISKIAEVRKWLVKQQQEIARENSIILDGRDIGTVVLKDAEIKFFLTASPEVRAKRRHKELEAKGQTISYAEVLEDIKARDHQDSTRKESPLKQAEDASLIDSSDLGPEEVIEKMLHELQRKGLVEEA